MTKNEKMSEEVVKTVEVIGINVKNDKKENLGEIEEIILDKVNGNARYVVLSFGGFLGMADKLFALPWNAINYDPIEECFMLHIDKEKLKNAPGFDKNHWPDMADRTWASTIYTYYGTKPYWNE